MGKTREIAVKLADEQICVIQQKGKVVDAHSFKGPIRLRLLPQETKMVKQEETC